MMETLVARSGVEIAKIDGRLLCSAIDPEREAAKWLEQCRLQIERHSQVIVLGGGCGFHLRALQIAYPDTKVLVIEPEDSLRQICVNLLKPKSNWQFVTEKDIQQFKSHQDVRCILSKRYAVLRFKPALAVNSLYYAEIFEILVARKIFHFNYLAQLSPVRAEIRRSLDLKQLDPQENMSIKVIERAIGQDASPCVRLMTQLLRELVI